jgi:hypothetical protein
MEGDKKVVWVMARQHAWETGTSWVMDGALRFLASNEPRAAEAKQDACRSTPAILLHMSADGV